MNENEYGDATELEVQALGVDSNDGCYPTPSSSRPSSSLSQAVDDSDVDNGNDSDFLNREAILNGVGTGKVFPKPMYAIPKARPVERVTSLSNTVEAPKVSRPAALADLEQAVATTTIWRRVLIAPRPLILYCSHPIPSLSGSKCRP